MVDKKLRQRITISLEEDKGKVRVATMNNSLKPQFAYLRAMQKMREEMDRVWEDFFEKNPDMKEEVARRWFADRLNSKDQHKGVLITVQNALRKRSRSEFK